MSLESVLGRAWCGVCTILIVRSEFVFKIPPSMKICYFEKKLQLKLGRGTAINYSLLLSVLHTYRRFRQNVVSAIDI
jgi:hypothetical protein